MFHHIKNSHHANDWDGVNIIYKTENLHKLNLIEVTQIKAIPMLLVTGNQQWLAVTVSLVYVSYRYIHHLNSLMLFNIHVKLSTV